MMFLSSISSLLFLLFIGLVTSTSLPSAAPCPGICHSSARTAYRSCWSRGRPVSNCHVIRCVQSDSNARFRGWSCSDKQSVDESPRPSPSPQSVTIPRGCREICRVSAHAAWDDCLYLNRTVAGCTVSRCDADRLPYRGWICTSSSAGSTVTPTPTMSSIPESTGTMTPTMSFIPLPSVTSVPTMSSSPAPTVTSIPTTPSTVEPTAMPTPTASVQPGKVATCFTDPHCRTFDGMSLDCQATGEFVLLKSEPLGIEIQGRFRGNDTRGSVTKGMVVKAKNTPTIQLSMAFASSSASFAGCPVLMFVDGSPVDVQSGYNSSLVIVVAQDSSLKIMYSNGMRLESKVYISSTFGCYFEFLETLIPESLIKPSNKIIGMFGTPNDDPFDDWQSSTGVKLSRNSSSKSFRSDYEYCTTHWCISEASDSLFTYERGTTFGDFSKCNTPFGEAPNFDNASPELLSLCGSDPSCLVDGVVAGIDDARATLNAQARSDEQRSVFSAFRFDPAIVAVNVSVNIRVTVDVSKQSESATSGLKGFDVYEINSETGEKSDTTALVRLVDDGTQVSSDTFPDDGIYSNVLAVKSEEAGQIFSFSAVPVYDGNRANGLPTLTALAAVRSYSLASGLGETGGSGNTEFDVASIAGLQLLVKYSWPSNQPDLDTATQFLDTTVGYSCDSPGKYLTFSGDDTNTGGTETITVDLDEALQDGQWKENIKVIMKAGWYDGKGSGPATVRLVLREGSGQRREVKGTGIEVAVEPGKQTDCAKKIVAVLNVSQMKNGSGYLFKLSKN